jgi:radical SAM-linked protein
VPGVPETTPAIAVACAGRTAPQHAAQKVRIRFRKSGTLRLLSHHDLMRTSERLLRRADLPFHRSQGFHPKPRLIFALSLPLGVVGCEEVVELELDRVLPLDEIQTRLARQTPPGLDIVSVRQIPLQATAQVRRLTYAVRVPAERLPGLTPRIAEALAAGECWVDRHRPHSGQPGRRLDIRPFLADLRLHAEEESAILEMVLLLTPAGTARPEEVLGLLGLQDLLDAGAVLERTRLELSDELPSSEPDGGTELEKGSHEKRDAD